MEAGSWWPDFAKWLGERSNKDVTAPRTLGNDDFPVLEPAPGTYVFDH